MANLLRVWLEPTGSGWAYRCHDAVTHSVPPTVYGYPSAAEAGNAARQHFEREHVLVPPDPEEAAAKLSTYYAGIEYHEGCGGEIYLFKGGKICARCKQSEDSPA